MAKIISPPGKKRGFMLDDTIHAEGAIADWIDALKIIQEEVKTHESFRLAMYEYMDEIFQE